MSKVVITGGAGYVGFRLGCHIIKNCPSLGQVLLFDTRYPQAPLPPGLSVLTGDICSPTDVAAALKGATLVYHIASYGMSGDEAMDHDRIYQVNVQGTQNIIDGCRSQGVARLVYVSSYNAVFDGVTPILGGTEATTQHNTEATCSDAYSLTKSIAEQAVLAADNVTAAQAGNKQPGASQAPGLRSRIAAPVPVNTSSLSLTPLRTCAVRPPAIWGPGEQRHVPRIIRMARQGFLQFEFGEPSSLVDFIHVDNLIDACVLAAQGLEGEAKAGGKAYFINDDNPMNNFVFFKNIMVGLGYRWPTMRIPYIIVYLVALLLDVVASTLQSITGRVVMVPLLSRTEVAKCAITHYTKCDLARKELGYNPVRHTFEATVQWYKLRNYGPIPESSEVRAMRIVRFVRVCMASLMVLVILVSWHNTTQKKLVADLLTQAMGAAGEAVSLSGSARVLGMQASEL